MIKRFILILILCCQVQAANFYVSNSGNDTFSGELPAVVVGSELVTNGDFSDWSGVAPQEYPDGWEHTTNDEDGSKEITQVDAGNFYGDRPGTGACNFKNDGGNEQFSIAQPTIITTGKTYRMAFDMWDNGGSIKVQPHNGSDTYATLDGTGSKVFYFVAVDAGIRFSRVNVNVDITIDNVSIKEVVDGPWEFAPSMDSASGVSDGTTLVAGDSVLFKGGDTWTETITVGSSGSAGLPITYGSYGVGPIFDGESTNANCITTNGKDYITLKNLILSKSTAANCLLSGNNNILENCIVTDGDAVNIQITGSSAILNNNTVNGAGTDGIDVDESCTIQNTIVFDSTGDDITIAVGKTVTGNNNCLEDAAAAGAGTYTNSNTLFSTDPQFVDAAGDDFKLHQNSPCINNGADVGLVTDFVGAPRLGASDIGAYEFQGAIRYRYRSTGRNFRRSRRDRYRRR